MSKSLVVALLLLAIVFLVAHLEYRFAPVEEAIRHEPVFTSKMGYPCETWIRQSGGGEPIFSCVKAVRE